MRRHGRVRPVTTTILAGFRLHRGGYRRVSLTLLMPGNSADGRPRTVTARRAEGLRTKQIRALIAAALAASLLLGGAVLLVARLHSTPSDVLDHPAHPITDDQSRSQVVEPARQIVAQSRMRTVSAGYALMSCKDQENPPYQGAIYLNFELPAASAPDTYFPAIATTLVEQGWTKGLPPNDHAFANIFSKDAVTAILYRQDEEPRLGVLRLYGQCRNTHDHRRDATSWIDITDQFTRTG